MIEKITNQNQIARHKLAEKINELIDAVNKLDSLLDLTNTAIQAVKNEIPADPYAEQRKWIGKVCKFRDNYEDKWHFGVLEEIYQHSDFPFGDSENYEWAICEPVKPDDDIIYKGE